MTVFYSLGIDPGERSGAVLLRVENGKGRFVDAIATNRDDAGERRIFLMATANRCHKDKCDIAIIGEKWTAGGPRANPKMMAGLGMAWGQWYEGILQAFPTLPATRMFRVHPQTWKSRVMKAGGAYSKDEWAQIVGRYVEVRLPDLRGMPLDVQAAGCIALIGELAEVSDVIAAGKPWWPA